MISPTKFYELCTEQLNSCSVLIEDLLANPLLDDLTLEQRLRLKAYILLCHSAIEEYIEALGIETLQTSIKLFKQNGGISRPIVALIASGILSPEEYFDATNNRQPLSDRRRLQNFVTDMAKTVDRSFGRYKAYVESKNHGIKSENLENIFNPLGIIVDSVLTGQLDSLGNKRGGIAHQFKAQLQLTASSAASEVREIIKNLEELDKQACTVLTSVIEPWSVPAAVGTDSVVQA